MISPRKLLSLPYRTRIRKLERILRIAESSEAAWGKIELLALHHLLRAVAGAADTPADIIGAAKRLSDEILHGDPEGFVRSMNSLRHRLRLEVGMDSADWDLRLRATAEPRTAGTAARSVSPLRLYLEDLRSPFNVGAIFRAAESFGIEEILLSPDCASVNHPRARRGSMGTLEMVPWRWSNAKEIEASLDGPQASSVVFLLETGGTGVWDFRFPPVGTMIVGSEELGASPWARAIAAASGGIVTIKTGGNKGSLNVAVAVGIVLHHWYHLGQK